MFLQVLIVSLAALIVGVVCTSPIVPPGRYPFVDGTAPFQYNGEIFNTYYKVFGNLRSGHIPLIVLHGGPGLTHDYLNPFADLTALNDTPVILYDQIGNGRSTHLRTKPLSFFTLDLFMDELSNLIDFLSIDKKFNLAGHSWGGILAAEFVVQRRPDGLNLLIIHSAPASAALLVQSHLQLLQAFPQWVQDGFLGGMSDPPKFAAAIAVYYGVHGCTVLPLPADYVYSFDQIFGPNGDGTVASAPIIDGNWTMIGRLASVKTPTLLINGHADFIQDFVIAPYSQELPHSKWVTFELSSHTPFYEERDKYFRVVGDFLAN